MEFYKSVRMTDVQLLATTWMNSTYIKLNQRSWMHRKTYHMSLLIDIKFKNRQNLIYPVRSKGCVYLFT